MVESFIKLVSESKEITEMGISSVSKLTNSSIGERRRWSEKVKELSKLLREVKFTDITMEQYGGARMYYPRFNNQQIVQLMNELKSINQSRFTTGIGKWRDVYPNDSDAIYMKTDGPDEFQRSHFPNEGIPTGIRNSGLSMKLYRALLRKVKYISSNTGGTLAKDFVWASLLQTKVDATTGQRAEDDVLAVVGPANWLALDKTMATQHIVNVVREFIEMTISFSNTTPDKFDMDDELIEVLPNEFLSNLSSEYLQSLKTEGRITSEKLAEITASRGRAAQAQQEEENRRAEAERLRLAEVERVTRKRLIARLAKYGADPDADWNIGDFIVVKQYLYQSDYEPLPIREVAQLRNGEYRALGISQMIRVQRNEITITDAPDARTTRDKTKWVKVNIDEIPDLDDVNLSREEKQYIENKLTPAVAAQRQETIVKQRQEQTDQAHQENTERRNNNSTYGFYPRTAGEIKEALRIRPTLGMYRDLLKSFKDRSFIQGMEYIILGPPQRLAMRNYFAVPVYIPWTGRSNRPRPASIEEIQNGSARLNNSVTGNTIDAPYLGLDLMAYPLSEVTTADKIAARGGQHFYVAGHQNVWGVLAKSEYGTLNTTRQQFIYLKIYGPLGRSVSVRLDLLRNIGAPISL